MNAKQMMRFFLLFILLAPFISLAQTFDLSGELRPRFENRHGYKTLPMSDDEPAAFVSQRTRLKALYADEALKVGITMQDVRVWGDVPQLHRGDDHLFIHEAWGELLFSEELSLKAGRQEIVYDDSRIFGNVGWAQQARSHDAAILKYQQNSVQVHAGAAMNHRGEFLFEEPYGYDNYKAFQYLWGNYSVDSWNVSLLALNTGFEMTGDGVETVYNQTIGGRIAYHPQKLFLSAASYIQMGKDATDNDLNANYLKLDATYNLTSRWKAGIGYEMLSGNDFGENGENNAFTPVFGTNHKFNGWMDYFYVGNHNNSVGLHDAYLSIAYHKGKISSGLKGHLFSSDGNIPNPENMDHNLDKGLGTEIDFHLKYQYRNNAMISAGYSRMFATETMEMLKRGDANEPASWFWMMITVTPQFL